MAQRLRHRGPDDQGEWIDATTGVALGHRRLSIIDLSPYGHQPMLSHSGRFVIAYNGEIYNYARLRDELDAEAGCIAWRGHSDTEVVLAAIERWGLMTALTRFDGMFAFALWDREKRQMHFARDRFGEKPLYYAVMPGTVLFGSELKSLAAHHAWNGEIDRGSLQLFMRFNYIPAPFTIYRHARKLQAGCVITVSLDTPGAPAVGEPRHYWSALDVAMRARERVFTNRDEARETLRELLTSSVRSRMVADVPVGAFLSGGIDSSLVVALMQRTATQPVRTFTIGFDDQEYDESGHAARVAAHVGTLHSCHHVSADEARAAMVHMPTIFDEPFADSSQIPTYLVSRAARQSVTVVLTGDGGDELFGGYDRYYVGQRMFPKIRSVPRHLRGPLAALIRMLPPGSWQSLLQTIRRFAGDGRLADLSGERLHRLSRQLFAATESAMYEVMMARPDDGSVSLGTGEPQPSRHRDPNAWPATFTDAEAMMLFDTLNILADDFLVRVDRASMSVSLETRAPLLDPALFELAWRLPLSWKLGQRSGKLFLREMLHAYVPPELVERPKQGFSIPVGRWIKGPLRDWAESLLDERRLRREGFLTPAPIRRKWAEHLAGSHDRQNELWSAIVFQEWLASTVGAPVKISAAS